MVGQQVRLASSRDPNDVIEDITQGSATNLNDERHHNNMRDGDWYVFKSDYARIFINFIVWSLSDHPNRKDTDLLKVDKNCGRMTIALFRGE